MWLLNKVILYIFFSFSEWSHQQAPVTLKLFPRPKGSVCQVSQAFPSGTGVLPVESDKSVSGEVKVCASACLQSREHA